MTCEKVSAQARVLRVLKALKGHTLTGLSNGEIATMTGESAPNVTRALAVLVDEGLAMRLDNGRYAHSIQMLQIAQAHYEHIDRITSRAAEINQRMAAGARS